MVFPEELTAQNPELNKVYLYGENAAYQKKECLEFMVPLYALQAERYAIKVRAYKGEKILEEIPVFTLAANEGSILDELRTRLR